MKLQSDVFDTVNAHRNGEKLYIVLTHRGIGGGSIVVRIYTAFMLAVTFDITSINAPELFVMHSVPATLHGKTQTIVCDYIPSTPYNDVRPDLRMMTILEHRLYGKK